MKAPKNKQQSNQYDKIFKENIEVVISSILQNILQITAISMEELPDDIQHTKERKPDILKKIIDDKGNIFVLQIEFQVADEVKMVYRMAEYFIMLERKYDLPVKQFVIFLGAKQPQMPTQLDRERLKFSFPLVALSALDFHIFLQSEKPEEIVLAILANFENETPENALKLIISRLEETTEGDLALKRYFKQLRVLAQLRKLEQKLKDIVMDSIAKYIDEEKDVAFLVGQEKGRQEEKTKFVTFLLQEGGRDIDQIADIAGVLVDFVRSVQQKLTTKS